MNLLLVLCLFWLGLGQPADLTAELETIAIEHLAGPVERWRPLVAEHFPSAEVDTAMCIIRHESGGDPAADNPRSSASGLFQILESLWGPHYGVSAKELFEPTTNVRLASDIWDQHGWRAWSPYKRGLCH
ncbi:MAG: transglycosylase SLT domain-containing protein [Acidimicrobiia bacterium]